MVLKQKKMLNKNNVGDFSPKLFSLSLINLHQYNLKAASYLHLIICYTDTSFPQILKLFLR